MAPIVMSKPCTAPVKVALRTQARSMAAPLVARLNRQTRGARFITRAAVDKSQVTPATSFMLHTSGVQKAIAESAVGTSSGVVVLYVLLISFFVPEHYLLNFTCYGLQVASRGPS